MKRLLCLLCISCLLLCGGTLALAEEEAATDDILAQEPTADEAPPVTAPEEPDFYAGQELSNELSQELTQITQRVKNQLSIDDSYSGFYGQYYEQNGNRIWNLNWEGDGKSVSVEASPSGQIFSYYSYSYDNYRYDGNFAPSFSATDTEAVRKLAEDFLGKVLQANESIEFDAASLRDLRRGGSNYNYLYGTIKHNNVLTPFDFHIAIDTAKMQISNFNRSSLNNTYLNYSGGFPAAVPSISQAVAQQKLSQQMELELAYSLTDNKEARLQYRLPNINQYVLDAQTGEIIDLQDYRYSWYEVGYGSASPTADSGGSRLTPAEEAGISKLDNLLTQAQLEQHARAIVGVDLQAATLTNMSYNPDYQNRETYYASLSFEGPVSAEFLGISEETMQIMRNNDRELTGYYHITLNARTGQLISFSFYGAYIDEAFISRERGEHEEAAVAFLEANMPEVFAQTIPKHRGYDNEYYFVQEVDGYPFTGNYLSVRTNPYTGQVTEFYQNWQEDVTFQPATDLISAEQAKQSYLEALDYRLAYVNRPLDTEQEDSWNWTYQLLLAYKLQLKDGESQFYGIDAHNGEKLYYSNNYQAVFDYDDLDGVASREMIERLSQYGVGYLGGSFQAQNTMRELDMLLFLVSANGLYYGPELSEDELSYLYQEAQYLGVFSGERNPEREISRGEYIKTIISMSGYGKAALIPNIYQLNLSNANSIADDLYGYLAIAQGLGMLESGGSFNASATLNREEAAVILYFFMDRQY